MKKRRIHKLSGKLTQKVRRDYRRLPKGTRVTLTRTAVKKRKK